MDEFVGVVVERNKNRASGSVNGVCFIEGMNGMLECQCLTLR
jgi:hypothetical protein